MALKGTSRTPQTSLNDEDVWQLLEAINEGTKYNGRFIGRKFMASLHAYQHGELFIERHDEWVPPPERYRLPIDDLLEELISRERSPKISEATVADCAASYGPFYWARSGLHFAVSGAYHPDYDREWAAGRKKLLEDIDSAAKSLGLIRKRRFPNADGKPSPPGSEWHVNVATAIAEETASAEHLAGKTNEQFETFEDETRRYNEAARVVKQWSKHFQLAYKSLKELRKHIASDPVLVRIDKESLGRPRMRCKEEFINDMVILWRDLTSEKPSRTEHGPFGRFVYAAWDSLDDEMPEVSFARAIRDHA